MSEEKQSEDSIERLQDKLQAFDDALKLPDSQLNIQLTAAFFLCRTFPKTMWQRLFGTSEDVSESAVEFARAMTFETLRGWITTCRNVCARNIELRQAILARQLTRKAWETPNENWTQEKLTEYYHDHCDWFKAEWEKATDTLNMLEAFLQSGPMTLDDYKQLTEGRCTKNTEPTTQTT